VVAITNKLDGDSSKTFLRRCLLAQAEQIDQRKAIFSLLLIGNSVFYCWRSRNQKSELQHSDLKMLSSCLLLLTFSLRRSVIPLRC